MKLPLEPEDPTMGIRKSVGKNKKLKRSATTAEVVVADRQRKAAKTSKPAGRAAR